MGYVAIKVRDGHALQHALEELKVVEEAVIGGGCQVPY